MNSKVLRVLRYNTGNDKKVFLEFKNYFDLVLVNANIVAYTKSAIVDLISIHKKEYVIDPQTHIFMHDPYFYSTKLGKIKKSIEKYLEEMPQEIQNVILREKTALTPEFLEKNIDNLNQAVYNFQKNSISKNLKDKEYNKYLEFSGIEVLPPKFLIATYFMLRSKDDDNTKIKWLNLNKKSIENFIEKKIENIAAQLVIDKEVLLNESLLVKIKEAYDLKGYEYIFLWIDDFSTFSVNKKEKEAFKSLIFTLNSIGKKVIMAYGGYDSILLCHDKSLCKLYGVAQSAGYGEFRKVTPVGGGMPTNKFYFFPLHSRMNIEIVLQKMVNKGYLNKESKIKKKEMANLYYKEICDCKQCREVIKDNIDNFYDYADESSYDFKSKGNFVSRNRPTTKAKLISDIHFMYCKKKEWEEINENSYDELIKNLNNNYNKYCDKSENSLVEWVDIFGK